MKNIVFVHCDSMDGRVMGCMGHPAAHTPNLDRLAREGVMHRNVYCNSPICVPSRASMMSGQFTHHCEGWNNFKGLEPHTPTWLSRVEAAGYRCFMRGKTDYVSGRHTLRARISPWTRSAGIDLPAYLPEAPVVHESDDQRVHQHDWRNMDACSDFLAGEARESRSGDRPFFLYLGLDLPHPPFATSRRWLDVIDPAKVTIPGEDAQDHTVMRYARAVGNWTPGFDEAMVRLTRRVYFAMVAELDAIVGHVREALERAGLADDSYFIFSSDHGEMAMEHRLYYKMMPYEPSVRVPLMVAGPGIKRGRQIEQVASLVDIYPTLMDMADLPCPGGLDGHSLMPELREGAGGGRPDWVLSECHDTTCLTGWFMLRRGRWKYIAFPGYEPMLFDLEADAGELRNVAGVRRDIATEMDGKLRSIVDYEAVDAKVKAYDRGAFGQWRQQALRDGSYRGLMARVHSGWDGLEDGDARIMPWTDELEERIKRWLGESADR